MRPRSMLPLLLLLAPACDYNNGLVDEGHSTLVKLFSFTPRSGPATGGVTVTLVGQNLRADMAVYFGETRATSVRATSSSSLEVTLPPGELGPAPVRIVPEGDGEAELTAPNPFRYRAGQLRFRFAQDLGRSGCGSAYGIGDVDGDGRNDVVVAAHQVLEGKLALYRGGADGGLAPGPSFKLPGVLDFAWGACPKNAKMPAMPGYSLAMGDFNGDGLEDVAVSAYSEQKLHLFWGSKTDGLRAAGPIAAAGLLDACHHRYLVPARLDGDEKTDLYVINHRGNGRLRPMDPEPVGTIGFVLALDRSDRTVGTLGAPGLDCTRLHGHLLRPAPSGDDLSVLCDTASAAGDGSGEALRLARLAPAPDRSSLTQKEDRLLQASVEARTRYHLFDFEADGSPEVVSLRQSGGGSWIAAGELEVRFGAVDPIGLLFSGAGCKYSLYDLGPPVLLATNIHRVDVGAPSASPSPDDSVTLAWPHKSSVSILSTSMCGSLELLRHRRALPPDWANSGPDGWPMMPTVEAGDVNGDGVDDLLTADYWGQTLLAYATPTGFTTVPSWHAVKHPDIPPSQTPLWPSGYHPVLANDRPEWSRVDLNGDGHKDILALFDGPAKPTARLYIGISDGSGRPTREQWIAWPSGDWLMTVPFPVVADLNGDGTGDLLVAATDPFKGTLRLHRVLSQGERHAYGGSLALSVRVPSAMAVELDDQRPGRGTLLVADRVQANGTYDLRVFSGDLSADALAEQPALARGIRASSDPLYLLDIDGDGRRDLVTGYSRVCWGADYGACKKPEGFASLCSSERCSPVHWNGLFPGAGAGPAEVIVFDEAGERAEWARFTGGDTTRLSTSLTRPEGRYIHPRVQALCDVDGDGLDEAIFVAGLEGRQGLVVGALARREAELEVQLLGGPAFEASGADCLDAAPLDNLLLRSSDGTYYPVKNDSY